MYFVLSVVLVVLLFMFCKGITTQHIAARNKTTHHTTYSIQNKMDQLKNNITQSKHSMLCNTYTIIMNCNKTNTKHK